MTTEDLHKAIRKRLRVYLATIEHGQSEVKAGRENLALACRDAHLAGLSLSEIGKELGVGKQRVHAMIQSVKPA